MSDEHVDYHVGLVRGYILAHNAPTIILHALDRLLDGYISKAGPVIGARPREGKIDLFSDSVKKQLPPDERTPVVTIKKQPEIFEGKEEPEKRAFWDGPDDKLLYEEYCLKSTKPREILKLLPHRTIKSIRQRITVRKLHRGQE